jgi:lipoprotein NlpD
VDSLADVVQNQNQYIDIMKRVISGDIKTDKVVPLDSLTVKKRTELLMTKSEKEQEFCNEFEKEEQYNLGILSDPKTQNAYVFFKPAKGVITNKYNPRHGHYGVDIATSQNENVKAVLDGTVVYSGFTIEEGYVIAIQHADQFLSIYKNNTQILKSTGAKVNAGESIAITGSLDNKTSESHFHFELWQNGKTVNPEEFIIF